MLKKLKLKFVVVTMGILLIMLSILFGLIYHFTKSDMESGRNAAIGRLEHVNSIRELPRDVELPYFIVFTNDRGEYLAAGYTDYDLNDTAFLEEIVFRANKGKTDEGILEDHDLLYCLRQNAGGTNYIFLDISSQSATLQNLIQNCVIIGVIGIVAFLVLSVLLARWMVQPVEKTWNQQKQFVSDASHELKTPLTVIMSNAELIQSGEGDTNRFADNVLTASKQMRHLVESLLELARADNGQLQKNFELVDFSQMVSEWILPFEPVYFEKHLQLRTNIQENIRVSGITDYLHQVVDILLDNAKKYTECGVIDLSLKKQGRQCLLSVANPGKPIPQEELTKIFQRFYRTDKSRSRDGSFGLGLSIADAIVKEHRGKIWAISNPTGNCFFVELPCEP